MTTYNGKKTIERIELGPHTDEWMMGDRYGTIIRHIASGGMVVVLDKSGRTIRVNADDVFEVWMEEAQ